MNRTNLKLAFHVFLFFGCIALFVAILIPFGNYYQAKSDREFYGMISNNNARNLANSANTTNQAVIITVCRPNTSHAQRQIQTVLDRGFTFKIILGEVYGYCNNILFIKQ